VSTKTATAAEIESALTPAQHAAFIKVLGTGDKTVICPILGGLPVGYRSDREIDILKITRARVCLARHPAGSKLAQIYAAQVAGIASAYQKGSI